MLAGSKEPGKSPNEILNPDSESTLKKSDFVTRNPISIFSLIKNAKNEEEKKKLNQLLETLIKKLPESFKIGAAVGEGDCFFDSVAQGLNELKDKGLITDSKGFSVKSLRENCKQYAQQVNQSKKGSWLGNALKGEGEKLYEYIPRIEFTAEDIENASSGSEIKILKLENAIWGRIEVEGKIICEKYSVEIRIIELRDEEIDGLHVTKDKVGTGNNVIYIVNYRNHFVPLLSNIEKDIKRSIKVSREEADGNVVGSNSNNISQSYISTPLQNIENSSHEQSDHSRSTGKENRETGRKRGRSVTDKDDRVSKKLRIDVNIIKDSEPPSDLQDEPRQDLSNEEIKFAKSVVGREGTPAFNQFLDFLITGEGTKYLEVLKRKGINLTNMSSILGRAGSNAPKAFKELYDLWFDKQENKTQYLKTLEKEGINLSNMSSILGRAGSNAPKAFKELYDLLFNAEGNKTQYLKTLKDNGVGLARMSSILNGAGSNAPKAFKELYDLWFDKQENETQYLKTLEKEGINLSNMSSILNGAGAKASEVFKELYDLWFDKQGNKTPYLKTLKDNGVDLARVSNILNGVGSNAPKAFKELYDLWFDKQGNKTQFLNTLEKEGINLAKMSNILSRAGSNAPKAFKELYDLWFDKQGNKTQLLKILEEKKINLANMSSILGGAGSNASKAFKELCDLWFDKQENKTQHLKTLEKEGISLSNMSSILHGAGTKAPKAFKELYDLWFDKQGNKTQLLKILEEKKINLANMSSILGGAGSNAPKAFKELCDLWFDKQENKTQHLKTLEKEGMNLANVSSILHGAGSNAPKAFKELYDLWFDKQENKTQYLKTLKDNGVGLAQMSSILNGAGSNAPKAFKELYNTFFDEQGNKEQHLKHFIKEKDGEKSFMMPNLSGILGGAGAKAKDAFENLHNVCFDDEGERTGLLDDFYNAGFRPSNLSSMLCGTGIRASSILERLHSVCFDDEGERTELLDDFYNAGFRPGDLSSILSAAADSLEKFHDFCFIGEAKGYLSHFLKEGFKPENLSEILHGARANICSALKDFHDICFDEAGNRTQPLDDFYQASFRPSDLSSILSMAGNNATYILRNFHRLCFNKENYLNHFLAEKKLFTPKNLSRVLHRVGLSICPAFEKLHGFCFDKAGSKTDYLNNLIKNNSPNTILNTLYKKVEKVKKAPSAFLDEQNISEEDKITNPGLNPSSVSGRAEQEQNLGSLQQGDSKIKRKTRKGITNQSKNRQDDKILDTVAGSSRDLSQRRGTRKKQIQSVHYSKRQREVFSHLSKVASSIEPVKQGLYLSSFKARGVEIDGRCVAITRGLSQALLLQSNKSFLSNLETSSEIYERIAQGKQVSKREKREVFAFSKLLDSFEQQLDSATNSLPLNLIYTKAYKTLSDLSNYIAEIEGVFAVHLVTSNHVIAIYRTDDNYTYFDTNAAFVSGLKSVDQLMQVVEKAVKFAGYEVGEKGFLVEHFDVDKANSLLSSEDKRVLTKEIKTERHLLAEQDKELGPIKSMVNRVQLYDFGTKIHVEGSVPLLINADMNLSSKKFQDHLDRKEVSMTAREYLDSLKNSKNVEEVVQATKTIPLIGSKREIEEAEQTRMPKQSLLELAKGTINSILAAVSFVNISWSESQLSGKTDNKPKTYLNDPIANNQLQRSL